MTAVVASEMDAETLAIVCLVSGGCEDFSIGRGMRRLSRDVYATRPPRRTVGPILSELSCATVARRSRTRVAARRYSWRQSARPLRADLAHDETGARALPVLVPEYPLEEFSCWLAW